MALLSENTNLALRTAAVEVLIRGVGPNGEYDYTIRDCLLVGAALDMPDPTKWLKGHPGGSDTAEKLLATVTAVQSDHKRTRGW